MKVFVVFFCMIIGYACVDSQLAENGEDDLKSNNNAWKADSLYDNETINEDQYNRSRGDNAPAQSADSRSKETEASEKPSSDVTPMTVTSEVRKSGQLAYLAARVIDLWSLLKHSHRHISTANRHSMEVKRSFPRPSAAIRDTDTDSAINTRESFRTKRSAERDAKRAKMEGTYARSDREMNLFTIYMKQVLSNQIDLCANIEWRLVDTLANKSGIRNYNIEEYKSCKSIERELLKDVVDKAKKGNDSNKPEVYINNYKLLIRDSALDDYLWDDHKIRANHTAFFDTPSPLLDKYRAMKLKEYETLDSFLQGSGPDVYNDTSVNEFGEPARVIAEKRNEVHKYLLEHGVISQSLSRCAFNPSGCATKKVLGQINETAQVEIRLLDSLDKTGTVPTALLDEYKAAKMLEMNYVKEQSEKLLLDPDHEPICKRYRTKDFDFLYWWYYLKDAAEEYVTDQLHVRDSHNAFFEKPSAALTIYEAMKRLEFHTFKSFRDGRIKDLYEGQPKNVFEEGATKTGVKPEFEWSKKKRASRSKRPRMNAKVFAKRNTGRNETDTSVWHVPDGYKYEFEHYFPQRLKDQCEATVKVEQKLIDSLYKTGFVPFHLLQEYKTAKTLERKVAKEEYKAGGKARMHGYFTLIWDFTYLNQDVHDIFRLHEHNKLFFDHANLGLLPYDQMKLDEGESIIDFVTGTGKDIYELPMKPELFDYRSEFDIKKYGFECPKKKRESGSQASRIHAQVFVIFLCMATGIFIVDLQRLEIGEDDLKANKNARKVKRSFPRTDRIN